MKMRNRKFLTILVMIISICLLVACGSDAGNSVPQDVVSTETEVSDEEEAGGNDSDVDADEAIEAQAEEVKVEAEDTVNAESSEQAAEGEATEDKQSEDAEVTAAAEEAVNDGINWDDITALETPVVMYAQKTVNIRKGPDTSFEKLGYLSMNDEVSVIGESKSKPWKEIKYKEEVAFVHADFLGTEQIDLEALKAAEEAATQAAAQAAGNQPAQAAAPAAPQKVTNAAGTLFIGDSRTCQMRAATGGGGCGWICEYCTTFDWFRDTAVPQADAIIGNGTKVVICMGVNDPGSMNNYANLVNQKAAEWVARGAKVYYVSINPVDHPYEDKTPNIDSFNAQMPGLLANVRWIDTASVVKQGGFVLEDGIHYDAAGNISIYNMIVRSLR